MRILLVTLASTALIAGTAMADHGHGKNKQDAQKEQTEHHSHGSGTSYGSDSSYGSGTHGDEMKKKADDHSAHGTMSHGMDHADMEHGEGHMKGSKTMPKDGAVLNHAPKMIGVNFGHAMMVDAITVSTLTGEMIELDVSEIGETSHVMVKAPELQPDDYIVDWRAKGHDGHVMSGTFSFTVE